ncbi:hypothetical protein CDCA_CDCA14G3804 [Cyanidium caldarium]|uniref:PsbP C-terminal domain-containing protein n=1 Tax=Cyanidium caldarium TaxID=2771 RepID=A0AAV9IZU3_CYACA|nr:hypothetical protein CDCA_CDCA14G3804 [Cyanidium caldarium]
MRTLVSRCTFLPGTVKMHHGQRGAHRRVAEAAACPSRTLTNSVSRRVLLASAIHLAALRLLTVPALASTGADVAITEGLVRYQLPWVAFLRPAEWTEDRLHTRQRPLSTQNSPPTQRLLVAFQSPLYPESDHLSVVASAVPPEATLQRLGGTRTVARRLVEQVRARPPVSSAGLRDAADRQDAHGIRYIDLVLDVYGRTGWRRRAACSMAIGGGQLFTFTLQSRADDWQEARFRQCMQSFRVMPSNAASA